LVAVVLGQQVQVLVQIPVLVVQLFVSPLEPVEHLCLVLQLLLVCQACYF
jgi:hypothetical protein